MDAKPVLDKIGIALEKNRIDAVLIGLAGAALHGAPVTTLDFDFMIRATRKNIEKKNNSKQKGNQAGKRFGGFAIASKNT